MFLRNGLEPAHLLIVVLAFVLIFGWKRLPEMARSLGRSARVFKSEVDQMKAEQGTGVQTEDRVGPATMTPVAPESPVTESELQAAVRRAEEAEQRAAKALAELDRSRSRASG